MSALSVHYTTPPLQVSPSTRKAAIPLRPHTFRVDNAVYDHCGPIIGAIGYAVYCAYSRYANRLTGECWPAVETIATQLDLSIPTVIKKRNLLAELGLLSFHERFGPSGRQTTHLTIVHTVDELEGRGKTGLPQGEGSRDKTDLPLVEQPDLTSRGASTEQEKTYTRRIQEYSMEGLKAVEQERQENDARQAKVRALDPQAYQALEAEARETLRNNPDVNLEFVMRSHLELVMYDLYQVRQPAVEDPVTTVVTIPSEPDAHQHTVPAAEDVATPSASTRTSEEVPDEPQATVTGPETDAAPGPLVSPPAAPEPARCADGHKWHHLGTLIHCCKHCEAHHPDCQCLNCREAIAMVNVSDMVNVNGNESAEEIARDDDHHPVSGPHDVPIDSGSHSVAADTVGSTNSEPAPADNAAGDPDPGLHPGAAPGAPATCPAPHRPGPRAPRRRRPGATTTRTAITLTKPPPADTTPPDERVLWDALEETDVEVIAIPYHMAEA